MNVAKLAWNVGYWVGRAEVHAEPLKREARLVRDAYSIGRHEAKTVRCTRYVLGVTDDGQRVWNHPPDCPVHEGGA